MSADLAHSKWSASGFESIMLCPGKKVLEAGKPNSTSKYAAEGTAAHQVLTWALQQELPAAHFLNTAIEADGFVFVVDEDMARHVQVCIDYANDLKGDDGIIFADIRVNYSSYLDTPEVEAWGTADVIVARGAELIVVDFKYGMGVEVSAEKNPQMSLYGLGALQQFQGIVDTFTSVRLAISQPRIKTAPSEYDLTVDELEAWGRGAAREAVGTCQKAAAPHELTPNDWELVYLRPGEKQCKFCKAKATCPALRAEVSLAVHDQSAASPEEFTDLMLSPVEGTSPDVDDAAWLAACLSKADLIEDWCKAVRAEVERRLLAGDGVPGYKLVQGKKGNRQWADAKAAEAMLKTMRVKLEDMYDFKLISPTSADKLAKAEVIGKRQWPKLQELIVQREGSPHVAPASDPRTALDVKPAIDDFENISDDLA
jgi:hypothetical protein